MNLYRSWLSDLTGRAENIATAHLKDEKTRRQNLLARRKFEPFVISLQGREVLYEEKFYCVIRVAQVFTDEWGMEAIAVPQFGFTVWHTMPQPPTAPWIFAAQWASKYLYNSTFGGGMFGWSVTADDELIAQVRELFRVSRPTCLELWRTLNAKRKPAGSELPSCGWAESVPSRNWYLKQTGEIAVYDFKAEPFFAVRQCTPLEHLRSNKVFFSGYDPSENLTEFAYGVLLREPEAAKAFKSLLSGTSHVAQLYGLRGLKELRSEDYSEVHLAYRQSCFPVLAKEKTGRLRYAPTAELVRQIHSGEVRITNEYLLRSG